MTSTLDDQAAPTKDQRRRSAWLFYCLLAIVLWGVWGIVSKAAENRLPAATIQVISIAGIVPAGLVLLASPRLRRGKNFLIGGLAAFFTGVCGSVGNLAMLLSFSQGGEASTVMPLTGMFPLVTLLLAVLVLRERINAIQAGGIAIALFALYLFYKPAEPAAATQPTALAWWQRLASPWMLYALGALVLWGIAGVLQKVATNHISTELATLLFTFAFIPVAGVVALTNKIDWNIRAEAWFYAILYGALIGVGTLILFAAYRTGKASIVTALYALYPALTVLLAIPIFGERLDFRTGAAIVLALLAGIALSYERQTTASQP